MLESCPPRRQRPAVSKAATEIATVDRECSDRTRPIPVIALRRTIGLKADMSGAHASAVAALGCDSTRTIAVPFVTRFFGRR